MGQYKTQLTCRNGHIVNNRASDRPEHNRAFCPQCGASTVATCENCQAPLRGHFEADRQLFERSRSPKTADAYCWSCGKPHPWLVARTAAVEAMLDELDGLSVDEVAKLKKSIPDIVAETPNSELATLRFKRAAAKAGQLGGKLLMDVCAKVGAEAVKKLMGL